MTGGGREGGREGRRKREKSGGGVSQGGRCGGYPGSLAHAPSPSTPCRQSEIGWVINNFSPRIGINAKGGTTIFPEVFGELGWRKLLMTGSEGTGGFRLTVPPGGLVEFSRGGALPHAYLASYLGTLAVVLAVAVALRARRSNRVSATASVTERARLRWRELRASERLAALAAGLLGLYGMAAIWPITWFKPAATSVTTLGWSDLALAGSPPLRMAMILNSPSYNMLYKYVTLTPLPPTHTHHHHHHRPSRRGCCCVIPPHRPR